MVGHTGASAKPATAAPVPLSRTPAALRFIYHKTNHQQLDNNGSKVYTSSWPALIGSLKSTVSL